MSFREHTVVNLHRVHILFRVQSHVEFVPRGNFGAIRATQ